MEIRTDAAPASRAGLPPFDDGHVNVNEGERLASVVGGGLLALYGLSRQSLPGVALAALGGVLLWRGASGRCPAYAALGVSTAGPAGARGPAPVEIERSVTVARPRAEVYAFWRQFETFPRFMDHLERVTDLGDGRSHWVAKPTAGGLHPKVEWDAQIVKDEPGEVIAWQSLPGADVDNAGRVRFKDAADGGTEVHVRIAYRPPAGALGRAVAGWLDPALGQMVKDDVRRFKTLLEAGEVPTTDGQSSGRKPA